ncbi:deoxyguanosinetriphosphate triphosphohydrolase [Corynebacterium sp. H113]|uniref:deoxyguanosinetriphosphate triphosphohydrolase n=1 Tax=Corynebacterium sp. H113 TaxID=3133419 RepID=UPI00309A3A7F
MFAYSPSDFERILQEGKKESLLPGSESVEAHRGDFSRDRARVLHSAALRRLADKTQVVGPREGDTPRTRLTHSLEVAQIARGIAGDLGADQDLAELAGLTHDIGHPPYGHNGERALNEIAAGCGGFEGNAQTLRILTRLEPKVLDDTGYPCGLNLTRAALDAACKYPWTAYDSEGNLRPKYGAYMEDAPILQWIRSGAPYGQQCLEAQIMDWADDVAYSVHDVEDGIVSGRVHLSVLWDMVELSNLADKGAKAFGGDPAELVEAAGRLAGLPVVARAASYDGSFEAHVALKRMTSELVGRFVTASVAGTRKAANTDMPLGRYDANLAVPASILAEVTMLKTIAVLYVMDLPAHLRRQDRERDRLHRVAEYLKEGAPGALDPMFRWLYEQADSDAGRLRVIVDQLASMTESQVEQLDHRIAGFTAAWG